MGPSCGQDSRVRQGEEEPVELWEAGEGCLLPLRSPPQRNWTPAPSNTRCLYQLHLSNSSPGEFPSGRCRPCCFPPDPHSEWFLLPPAPLQQRGQATRSQGGTGTPHPTLLDSWWPHTSWGWHCTPSAAPQAVPWPPRPADQGVRVGSHRGASSARLPRSR